MSAIQWTDETWNWLVGCSRISPGCDNCYAATAAKSGRLQRFPQYQKVSEWDGTIEFVESALEKPLKWRNPRKIFTCSMSDVFHGNVKDEWIDKAFAVMAVCHQHTFQILTKRPERAREYFAGTPWGRIACEVRENPLINTSPCIGHLIDDLEDMDCNVSLPNIWLGVTTEDQIRLEERIAILQAIPAAVKFISCEPLLEELNFSSRSTNWLSGIDQVIVGGESGLGSRGCQVSWIESIINQCQERKIPVFVKQLGSNSNHNIRSRDRKGGDIEKFPPGLKIREFPIQV